MPFDPARLDPVARAAYEKGLSCLQGFAAEVAETDDILRTVVADYVKTGWTRDAIVEQALGFAHDWCAEGRQGGLTRVEFLAVVRGILDQALDDSGM